MDPELQRSYRLLFRFNGWQGDGLINREGDLRQGADGVSFGLRLGRGLDRAAKPALPLG